MTGRKRASGLAAHEQKFARVRMPDGKEARIPQAKDAATYVCMATPDGGWPDTMLLALLYDATYLIEGKTFEVEEMRPGYGMGTLRTLRILTTRVRVQHHNGNYGQTQRWLLCEWMDSIEERMGLSADELDGN